MLRCLPEIHFPNHHFIFSTKKVELPLVVCSTLIVIYTENAKPEIKFTTKIYIFVARLVRNSNSLFSKHVRDNKGFAGRK